MPDHLVRNAGGIERLELHGRVFFWFMFLVLGEWSRFRRIPESVRGIPVAESQLDMGNAL